MRLMVLLLALGHFDTPKTLIFLAPSLFSIFDARVSGLAGSVRPTGTAGVSVGPHGPPQVRRV